MGVFYQSFSLLPSISNPSVSLNPPINLPEGNARPLFLYLIIDSLLQAGAFYLLEAAAPGAWERMRRGAGSAASIRSTVEVRPSSQRCCRNVFDLGSCMCQGHQEITDGSNWRSVACH